jgi:hypothetical protein
MIALLGRSALYFTGEEFLNGAECITASWMPDRKPAEL